MMFDWNKATKKLFDTLHDFKVDAFHLGGKKSYSFAIDKERKKICFVKRLKPVFYDFNQIYKCDSFVQTYYERESKTGSFTGTAKVNGERVKVRGSVSVLGDIHKICDKMGLEITIKNDYRPVYTALFISQPTYVNSDTYETAYDLCLEWDSFFDSHAIEKDKTDSNNRTVSLTLDGSTSSFASKLTSGTQVASSSIADEILKLKNLLDQGALTQEEFEAQKAKILNG
ncbi:SHOCT domain-containing protein [Emticicia sp. C21]|nr:SHOCT domain-containing protein [Emticicia sp. C21]